MSAADDDDPAPTFDPPTASVPVSPGLRAASRRSRPPDAFRKATMLGAVALADRAPRRRGRKVGSMKATLTMGSIPEPHPDDRPTAQMRVLEGPRLQHTWFDGAQVAALPAPPQLRVRARRRRPVREARTTPSRRAPTWVWIALLLMSVAIAFLVGALVALR
ncbi:MAG: hypothetical protein H6719_06945 [Sandaracinaceae bacterium]|nr:hypothetical protein [Sandaracinaceae bacterium]